ncbi:type 1 glutamine amidotransferase domain-containing protein [Georgenia sp. Z1491]|uniref:type 1 glutamine amidotransferase domain-containing protein n=1 Tax=Georgenia sp. Z1491 TaxID=3416707 RepID=UPI003CF9D65C
MMAPNISGKKVAFIATTGVEQSELAQPWKAVTDAGGEPTLISLEPGTVTSLKFDWDRGEDFEVDLEITAANPDDYQALVLPGGTLNADALRTSTEVRTFVRAFFDQHKPVAAICHAPWILIDAGVVDGRRMTSVKSVEIDLKNAGADWVDEEVVVDAGLTTSRTPADLAAFCAKVVEEIAEGKHSGQTA